MGQPLSKSLSSPPVKERAQGLLHEIWQLTFELWDYCRERLHWNAPLSSILQDMCHRFYLRLIILYKYLLWLLAPGLMFRICLRHFILFSILFVGPFVFRKIFKPLMEKIHFNFYLRLFHGKEWLKRYRQLLDQDRKCKSFEEYQKIAEELDEMDGLYAWKIDPTDKAYNYNRIKSDLVELKKLIAKLQVYRKSWNGDKDGEQDHINKQSRQQYQQQQQQQQQHRMDRNDGNHDDDEKVQYQSEGISSRLQISGNATTYPSSSFTFSSSNNQGVDSSSSQRSNHPLLELMEFLKPRIGRNYCGINNDSLYAVTRIGTKKLIMEFNHHMIQALELIVTTDDPDVSIEEKIVFFQETRHVMGRTSLCLSGGATLGAYHVGVVYALMKQHLLPRIITGSSVGSVIAVLIGTKTEAEFDKCVQPHGMSLTYFDRDTFDNIFQPLFFRLRRLWRTGNLLDAMILRDAVRTNIGDLTFLEAYEKTGRILNITVTSTGSNNTPRLLNYLTAPNVVVWSAVIASCAIPLVFGAQELYVKEITIDDMGKESTVLHPIFLQGLTFSDGSLAHDLPMARLQQLFNVDNFIVSQVNPHLVPFLFHSIKSPILLLHRLFRFLCNEFHLYLSSLAINLREFGISGGFRTLNDIISQHYTGNVTIVPDVETSDYLQLLSNPTDAHIQKCLRLSERSMWTLMSRVQGLCSMEICLDNCLQQLRADALLLQTRLNEQLIHSSRSNLTQDATSPDDFIKRKKPPKNLSGTISRESESEDDENRTGTPIYDNRFSQTQKPAHSGIMNRIKSFEVPARNEISTTSHLNNEVAAKSRTSYSAIDTTGIGSDMEHEDDHPLDNPDNIKVTFQLSRTNPQKSNDSPMIKKNKTAFHRSMSMTELVSELSPFS